MFYFHNKFNKKEFCFLENDMEALKIIKKKENFKKCIFSSYLYNKFNDFDNFSCKSYKW